MAQSLHGLLQDTIKGRKMTMQKRLTRRQKQVLKAMHESLSKFPLLHIPISTVNKWGWQEYAGTVLLLIDIIEDTMQLNKQLRIPITTVSIRAAARRRTDAAS